VLTKASHNPVPPWSNKKNILAAPHRSVASFKIPEGRTMNGETRFARLQYIQHQQNFVDLIASLADFRTLTSGFGNVTRRAVFRRAGAGAL